MSSPYSLLAWSPVLIGFMLSTFMYGTTLGQSIYYSFYFPKDPRFIKILVFGMFIAETAHLIGTVQLFWTFFVACHRSNSWDCDHHLPWGALVMTCLNNVINFTVQCFYCSRIWIISGKNKTLTVTILACAFLGFASGVWFNVNVARTGTIQYLFQCPLVIPITVSDVVCDVLIGCSVFNYMWKSGFREQRTIIQDLALVFINMGIFTGLVSSVAFIMFVSQGHGFWVAAIGVLISQSYVNSMMAVLNARKAIRERDVNIYELPTIRMIG